MSLYKIYENTDDEVNGVKIPVGPTTMVTIARSGGKNKKFEKMRSSLLKPHRRLINAGKLSDDQITEVVMPAYIKTIIKNWETKVDGQWVTGIETDTGEVEDFTPKNIEKILTALPDLYEQIILSSDDQSLFNQIDREDDGGN